MYLQSEEPGSAVAPHHANNTVEVGRDWGIGNGITHFQEQFATT